MADYVLTEFDSGSIIALPDGAITSLKMTSPPLYESFRGNKNDPSWRLRLGGTLDSNWAILDVNFLDNAAIPRIANGSDVFYRGDFAVGSIPRGSVWSLSLA
jgi:hypothetical protein